MKKIYLTLFIFISFSIPLFALTITQTELLGRPTNNSITISLFFDDTVSVAVQYGTISGNYPYQTGWQNFSANSPAVVNLTGLTSNTTYYYRILYKAPNTSNITTRPEYHFSTQKSLNAPFKFIVQADPHMDEQSDTALYSLTLKNELEDSADFMIDLGDFLMTDKLKNSLNVVPFDTIPYRCKLLRKHYEKACHSLPLMIALGNHEGESGWNLNGTPNNIAVWDAQVRKQYFNNPYPNAFYSGDSTNNPYIGQRENYYAWTWGNALFIVLDPYWYTSPKPDSLHGWRWTLGKTQYDWLKQTLENSTAQFKFVFAHQLVGGDPDGRGGVEFADKYEWGGDNLDGTNGWASNRPNWYKPIKDLLTEHRVNIFFHGHDHFFGKQEKDCLIYQETPQPSHPNFTSTTYATDYGYVSGQILPNSGHIRVTVDSSGVKVEYVRTYLPINESSTRHNKDVSATYVIGSINCYDSIAAGIPTIYNADYADEVVFPNPFMDKTRIGFSLSNTSTLSLGIFNEQGVQVKQLLQHTTLTQGDYQIIWDGKNNYNAELPNGVYLYRLQDQDGHTSTGKIILQRNL